jgi:hypothetical protein
MRAPSWCRELRYIRSGCHQYRLARTSWGEVRNLKGSRIQIIHFYQSDADNDFLATYDRGVVTRQQVSNDRRLSRHSRSMPAVLDSRDLVGTITLFSTGP